MKVVDDKTSEHGLQRRKMSNGRLLHCCCICGVVAPWTDGWSTYCSIREIDDGLPIPKFCSEKCRLQGGVAARDVTPEMKQRAKDAEWRPPTLAYREATDREKYRDAMHSQRARLAATGTVEE